MNLYGTNMRSPAVLMDGNLIIIIPSRLEEQNSSVKLIDVLKIWDQCSLMRARLIFFPKK